MANFQTHLTFSTILGAGYGAAAYSLYPDQFTWPTCALAGGLCSVSGMLPDIDSGPGRPLKESLAFAAAVVPMMLMHRFLRLGWSHESIILAGAGVYLAVRFGLGWLLRHYTVHRGMFHSLPAAAIFGEIAFLLASGDTELRLYKAGAVVFGYLSHLLLDEVYSFEWRRGLPRLKQSFGTALKLFSDNWWANISTYVKLAILTFIVFKEPGWTQTFYEHRVQPASRTAEKAVETLWR